LVSSPPSNQGFKGISSLLLRPFDSNHASLRASGLWVLELKRRVLTSLARSSFNWSYK